MARTYGSSPALTYPYEKHVSEAGCFGFVQDHCETLENAWREHKGSSPAPTKWPNPYEGCTFLDSDVREIANFL